LPSYVSAVQPRPRSASAAAGKIAYPVFDALRGTYDIFLADAASGESRKLVENASQPALSPSGKYLAYRSWANDKRGLISRDLGGTEIWRFTSYSEAARPSWSPQEDMFVYPSRQESDRIARLYRTRDANAEGLRRDGEVIKGEAPAFVDADTIVYKGCLGNNCGLIACRLDGSAARQVTDNLSDTNPAASPDGAKIAFMSLRTGNWNIFVMNRDGSHVVNLTPDNCNAGLPAWSPDGRSIAFASDRNGAWGLWIMAADGSHPYQFLQWPGSPDGRVRTAQPFESVGWAEERLSWSP
jgi:TolB protein